MTAIVPFTDLHGGKMLVDANYVAKKIGCSPRHVVERLRHRPGFPKPVPELKRPLKWRLSELKQYCGEK